MRLRTVLFWMHLTCGVAAGLVILMMCVTGALLTYQRQITAWADMRGYHSEPPAGAAALSPDELVARVKRAHPELTPTTVVIRSDRSAPASLAVGPGRQLFVNPYSGVVYGEGNGQRVRDFFRVMVEWHRYVAMSGDSRPTGRAITGASNLLFLLIVLSGPFLWWPKTWTWPALRNITWFKRGLGAKARDFNWHNAIGIWSAIPLAIIVAGGVVISYPWATGLVYRAYGEQPPASAPGATAGRPAASAASASALRATAGKPVALETLIAKAEAHMPDWKTISVPLAGGNGSRVALLLDSGDGGQPHKRATLTLNRNTGEVERWEPYSSQSAGRRARTWLRFAHTGEVYGLIGQTVAGLVTAGGAVLVYTGLALALRRFLAWRKRSRMALPKAA